nr:MAG TPA: hypothetical protein [Caudoviricetes sp.]
MICSASLQRPRLRRTRRQRIPRRSRPNWRE